MKKIKRIKSDRDVGWSTVLYRFFRKSFSMEHTTLWLLCEEWDLKRTRIEAERRVRRLCQESW